MSAAPDTGATFWESALPCSVGWPPGELPAISVRQLQDLQRAVVGLGADLRDLRARLDAESSQRAAADQAAFGELANLRNTVDELLDTMLGNASADIATFPRGTCAGEVSSLALSSLLRASAVGSQGQANYQDGEGTDLPAALSRLEALMSERLLQLCRDDVAASLRPLEAHVAEVRQSLGDHLASHRLKEPASPPRGGALKQLEAHVAEMRVHAEQLQLCSALGPCPCSAKPDIPQAGLDSCPREEEEGMAALENTSAIDTPVVISEDFVQFSQEHVAEELARFQREKALNAILEDGSDVSKGCEDVFERLLRDTSAASSVGICKLQSCDTSSPSCSDLLQLDAAEVDQAKYDMEFLRSIVKQHQQTLDRGNR